MGNATAWAAPCSALQGAAIQTTLEWAPLADLGATLPSWIIDDAAESRMLMILRLVAFVDIALRCDRAFRTFEEVRPVCAAKPGAGICTLCCTPKRTTAFVFLFFIFIVV
jgi:hypothetical protein